MTSQSAEMNASWMNGTLTTLSVVADGLSRADVVAAPSA